MLAIKILMILLIFSTLVMICTYASFYRVEKKRYITMWMLGWVVSFLGQITIFLYISGYNKTAYLLGRNIFGLTGALLILIGTCIFIKRTVINKEFAIYLISLVIIFISDLVVRNNFITILITQIVSGVIYLRNGWLLYKFRNSGRVEYVFLPIIFIIWGIHKLDYIFLYNSTLFMPWRFIISYVIHLIVNIGLTLVFLKTIKLELIIAKEDYNESEYRYRSLFSDNRSVMFFMCPETGMIIDANKSACKYYGYDRQEIISMNINDISMSMTEERIEMIKNEDYIKDKLFDSKHRLANGDIRDVEVYFGPIKLEGKKLLYTIVHDITDRKNNEKIVFNMAYFNSLTGLPNRVLFEDNVSEAIYHGSIINCMIGVLLINVDRMKTINYTLGRNTGDKLIKHIANRLKMILPKEAVLSHLGGDEFAVLLSDIKGKTYPQAIGQGIIEEFQNPLLIDEYELFTSLSIGISIYPEDGKSLNALMKNADIAMSKVKKEGGDGFGLYNKDMINFTYDDFLITNNLKNAIERNELVLYYQPKTDISSGEIVGMEALVRWIHPELGLIPPGQFISIAEETGYIVQIGEWVLKTACLRNKEWQNKGYRPLKIAVNISARQLHQSNFFDMVRGVLAETGLEPEYLELEITESIAMDNIKKLNSLLNRLKELGVTLALDDFGTGYSSLSFLNQLSVDILKIDQSFIRNLELGEYNKEIVNSIIKMAHALDLKVIAEGVETQGQMNFLREKGCDYVQGYYYGMPVPDLEFEELFLENRMIG